MNYRKLRIAWAVGWGMLAVLLCIMWTQSYWQEHLLKTPEANPRVFASRYGGLSMHAASVPIPPYQSGWTPGWGYKSQSLPENYYSPAWQFDIGQVDIIVSVPHWSIALVLAIVASMPWIPYRFSLRNLLIATTVLAIALGIIIAANR